MRSVRAQRRSFFDLRRIPLGDWIVLFAGVFAVASLFMPWFMSSLPTQNGQWAFSYSEVASLVVIASFLVTLFMVIYPVLAGELGLRPLPFSVPLVYFGLGFLLLLLFVYELGKYACIQCQGVSRGYGVWVGFFAAFIYLFGAVIRWGSQPQRRQR